MRGFVPGMPKRRFFQIHLSTAVVLMLVAGVLVWANVRERQDGYGYPINSTLWDGYGTYSGWPIDAFRESGTNLFYVLFNFSVATLILFILWFACEWRIRREARKANE